jgi:carbon monoxide dehydrogenase subunit G
MTNLPARIVLAFLSLSVTTVAFAHGPTREKYSESIEIAATPEAVWALVGDYAHPEKWMSAVESTVAPATLDKGAVRELKIKGASATLKEELKNVDAEKKTIQYKIVDPTEPTVAPVNNYSARITVEASGTGAKVEWDAAFYRWFLNNNPPDGQNEAAARGFVEKIVHDSLASLKATAEKK